MYNEFYGLSEKPFELLPDPKFLFLTTSRRKIIASVMDGIRSRRGFISITGEVGTGKTTLIRYLLSRFENEERGKTAFIFHSTISFKDLLKNILLELNLKVMNSDKRSLLHQLNEYLTLMDTWEESLIIVIDEAQDLSSEVLGELAMLPKRPALQIVFVGQPEFEDKLNLPGLRQLKQKIGIKHQIRAFSEEESKNYIDHRLRLVRSSSSETFAPKAISRICSYAKGIPRIINILCDNAFLMGYCLSEKKIGVDIIRAVIEDMEGPLPQKTFFSSIATAIKEFRLSPPRSHFLLSKTPLIVLSLLCLGGFVFLIDRYFQPRPAKTWDIKAIRGPYVKSKPSLTSPPPQKKMREISESESRHQPEEPVPVSPPTVPLPLTKGEDKLVKIVTIKKGQTISSLARKYYDVVNPTVIDLILNSNPDIRDVHLILVGKKIKLPKITEESLIIKTPEDTYNINIGVFQRSELVRFYANEPNLKGREVKILPRKVSLQETWYRVVVGPFGHKDDCLRVIAQLKEKELLPVFGGILEMEW